MSSFQWSPLQTQAVPVYATLSVFPASGNIGDLAVDASTGFLYEFNGSSWVLIAGGSTVLSVGTIDSTTASANGAVISANSLIMQSASVTVPGLVNTTTQSFAGNKTFTGSIAASNLSGTNTGDLTLAAVGAVPNTNGASLSGQVLTLQPANATNPGVITSGSQTIGGAKTFSSTIAASNFSGSSSGTNTGDVTIGTGNGLSLASQALSLALSSTSTTGALSNTDWNTFNGKQASGNYITALTGDATASGPGSVALTLASVNGNVGSFTYSSITVNAKGLITAASSGAAPVTTLAAVGAVPNANGGSISSNTLTLQPANTSFPGVLTAADWNTFNGKQASGNYITALTGDVTASGPGSVAATIAANAVSNAKFRQSVALSIVGNSTNSTANVADITGTTDQVLRVSSAGTVLGFGAINLATSAAVSGILANANTTAASANTASAIVTRDGSGNFSAGTISAALTGTASGNTTISGQTNHGVVVASAGNSMTSTAAGTSGQPLLSGGASADPAYGTLAIAAGGTGQVTKAAAFDALSPMTTGGDIIYGGASGTGTRLANGSSGQYLKSNGTTVAPSWATFTTPTVQNFTSGTAQTYTTPAGVKYIRVRMVGAGGGGGGSASSAANAGDGGAGGNTTFGSSLLVANGGGGGSHNASGVSTGGTASLGSGPIGIAFQGGNGFVCGTGTTTMGGQGGTSPFGGAGAGGANTAGTAAIANTGSGGGGGGNPGSAGSVYGGGGAAGGFVDAIISSPSATYLYTIGAAGSAGSAGTSGFVGGVGAAGYITVEEHYQ